MTVRVNKDSFNLREKLSELERPIGLKGSELMRSETAQEARNVAGISNGRKNILYNGDFKIAQRDAGTQSGSASGYLTVDRWYIYNTAGGSNITHGRDSDVPDEGYSYSYKFDTTGGSPPTSNSNYIMLRQYIEVSDVKHLAFGTLKAKSLTMSFWFKSNHSGTITWNQMIQNSTTQRQISRQVQVHGDGAWHKYEMTIPGDIAGGAIQSSAAGNAENYSGLYFDLVFWSYTGWTNGSRFNDTWQNNVSGERAVGHINLLNGSNQYVKITGVQLEVGRNATDFEHRFIGEELALCQRYFWQPVTSQFAASAAATWGAMGISYSANSYYIPVQFPTAMRIPPSVGGDGTWRSRRNNVNTFTPSFGIHGSGNVNGCILGFTGGSISAAQAFWFEAHSTDANLFFNAEL